MASCPAAAWMSLATKSPNGLAFQISTTLAVASRKACVSTSLTASLGLALNSASSFASASCEQLALQVAGFLRRRLDDVAVGGRQARQVICDMRKGEHLPFMAGQGDEFVDLVELGRGDVGERVFLAVDDALLQRDVELAEADLLGRCAQRLEDVDRHRVGRRADLQALQVGRGR